MNLNGFTLLAIVGMLMACHRDRVVKQDVNRTAIVESKDVGKNPEYDAPVDESVTAPAQITGAYLVCIKVATDATGLQQKVGCRVEGAGAVVLEKERAEKLSWTYEVQGSAVDIKVLDAEAEKSWLALFSVQADATSVQSKIVFDLTMTVDGMSSRVKTDLVMIWNEDCALPAIQFETLGEKNGVGTAIGDQFKESHGVRFSTISGTPVVLAGYNQTNPVGYYGGPSNTGNYLAPNQNAGKFFITDRHKQAEATDTLVIEYDRPVKEASMDLVDIDFSETYVIRALNNLNQTVDELQFQAATGGARDGQLSRFVVRSPDGSSVITKLQIYGFNPPGALGIGFGIDNIATRCSR